MKKKRCSKCEEFKSIADFYFDLRASDLRQSACKECCLAGNRRWAANNIAERREIASRWARKNRKFARLRHQARRDDDPAYRIIVNLRSRIGKILRGEIKVGSTIELIGLTPREFKLWIESKFLPGMCWLNYGIAWEIDHIRPCSSFRVMDEAEQRACCIFTNLRPLWSADNRSKHDKLLAA